MDTKAPEIELSQRDGGPLGFQEVLDEGQKRSKDSRNTPGQNPFDVSFPDAWSLVVGLCDTTAINHDLQRYINFLSIINFGFTLQAGWETLGLTMQFALTNGGPASLVYGCILAGFGSTAIAMSLSEMAST